MKTTFMTDRRWNHWQVVLVFLLTLSLPVVRATNSGVSLVIGPDGKDLGRIQDALGKDRSVKGFGAWTVPVPGQGAEVPTPYARFFFLWRPFWLLLALFAWVIPARSRNRPLVCG